MGRGGRGEKNYMKINEYTFTCNSFREQTDTSVLETMTILRGSNYAFQYQGIMSKKKSTLIFVWIMAIVGPRGIIFVYYHEST